MRRILRCFTGLCFLGLLSLLCIFFRTDLRQKYVQPSIEALFLHNTDLFVEEYSIVSPKYACPSNASGNDVEDVLCMEPKKFLKNFKNPCWYEHPNGTARNSSSNPIHSLRCLPYFHIFGVCKTGTTDLFYRLIQHPQILPNAGILGKETWFWSWRRYGDYSYEQKKVSVDEFTKAFDAFKIGETKMSLEDWSQYSDLITGHGDPMDFWDHRHWRKIQQNDPHANVPTFMTPHLVKHSQPNIKLILLLREPAERLYSHYYHGGYGKTAEEFHHDVISGIQLLNECVDRHSYRTCLYKYDMTKRLPLPLSASLYYIHLQEWLDVFPREQIFVFRNEDYKKDKQYSLFKLFEFLEVGDISTRLVENIVNLPHAHETKRKATEGSMLNETWEILAEFFEEPNRKLAELLNDDRYLWKDVKFRYKPKVVEVKNKTMSKTDQLRRYYERKKKSKPHPHSEIDRSIKASKNFDEWIKTIKTLQKQRDKAQNATLKKVKVPYRQKKVESEKKTMKKYNLEDKSLRDVNITVQKVRTRNRTGKEDVVKRKTNKHIQQKRSIKRVQKQQFPTYNFTGYV